MKTLPYWFDPSAARLEPLERAVTADAVVVGGGIAGLTVAELLSKRGMDVVVLEGAACGDGATGRSSGFITPDSELQAAQLLRRFGVDDAGLLWRAASEACEHVRTTMTAEDIDCDFVPANSLYVGIGAAGRSTVEEEHHARRELGLPSTLYSADSLPTVFAGTGFDAAVRYEETFAITPYRYVRALRDRLRERGVRVFENSPVVSVAESRVQTDRAEVRASKVFLCADRFLAHIGGVQRAAYHAQTFLAATDPLPAERFKELFPDGDLLVWDTDLIYQYFRRTSDHRLLLGGGFLRNTYGPQADPTVIQDKLREYVRKHIPIMAGAPFTHVWSGLIGVTKDLLPIAGRDARSGIFYAGCAAGIPWSVLAARCAVESAMDGASAFDRFFDPRRAFTDLDPLQSVLGKPVTFSLSHAYAKGALRGSARAVQRRKPFVAGAALLLIASMFTRVRRWLRR